MNAATQTQSAFPSYDVILTENLKRTQENQQLIALLSAKDEDIARLEERIRLLLQKRFGRSSEVHSPGQGTLFNEAETIASEEAEEEDDAAEPQYGPWPKNKPQNRGKPKRKPLPADLPRVDRIIDLPESEKFCSKTGAALVNIGEEISEQLDYHPGTFSVIRTRRLKYVCNCDECKAQTDGPTTDESPGEKRIKIAPPEPQAIPKSFASPSILAHITVAKFSDALPLNRQTQMFDRIGYSMPRQTMASWMIACGKLVTPLLGMAKAELLRQRAIFADETRVKIIRRKGKKGGVAKSYMWVFMTADRDGPKIVLYELGPSRSHTVPQRFLGDYVGYLQTDGYESYETLVKIKLGITLVGDWVHVRRKFDEAIKSVPKEFKGDIKAKVAFDMINELFRIESKEIPADASDELILKIRAEKSRPILDKLKAWADETVPTVPPKRLTGVAINYMLERWKKLELYLTIPFLGMHTNPVEQAIRPFVIGRKNWLFSDTLAGAEASAALYSLTCMAKAHGLNPYEYLKAVYADLPKAKTDEEIAALLPWNWKQATAPPTPTPVK